jgi:Matrixin/PEP-CTERM motif
MKKTIRLLVLCSTALLLITTGLPTLASAYVIGPTTPGKWGDPTMGTGATVTWSLMATGTTYSESGGNSGTFQALGDFMPTGYFNEIVAAFDAWATYADLTFIQVPDTGEAWNATGSSGDIRLGGHTFDGAYGTLAHGYYPPNNGSSAAGDIHFDVAENWSTTQVGSGFDIFTVAAHEIGHALGLGHELTEAALMNPYYSESFRGPLQDDIDGIEKLYGPPATAPVPEPGTAMLIATGLMGLAFYKKRTRKITT